MRPRGLRKHPERPPGRPKVLLERSGGFRGRFPELSGSSWGAPGELSGTSWDAQGASWGALGRLLDAFGMRKSSLVAESMCLRESSSRLDGSIENEV